MKNLIITVSGGRSSAMMARHIQVSEKYKDYNKLFVFCNTGMEHPKTIEFLKNIEKYWDIPLTKIEGVYSLEMGVGVGYKIVGWNALNMTAKPFENAIAHKNKGAFNGMPNLEAPFCSEMLKTLPAKKFADDIFGVNSYLKAVGFRKEDMPKRISWAEIKTDRTRIFPLLTDFQFPIGQMELNKFWDSQPFKLEIHNKFGNCELCWKKSETNLIDVIRNGTRFIDWYRKMEGKYGNTSFRGHKSIDDLVELSKLPFTGELNFEENKCVCNF
ncbi:phosphoadenosine phosphosulfate reductase [Riemerella anatipestifer]|nr:phosphoadenosine phosphosulfate reductase [Riemerella anatipestifer]